MVRGDLQNKYLIGDTWLTKAYMRTLKYLLVYAVKQKARVHQLYFIGGLLEAKFKNMIFVKLDSRYADYFRKYSSYFGRALILLKIVYGITNSGKLFYYELIEWLFEAGFIKYQFQMSIYYKYAPYGTKIVVSSYVYGCVSWYTYKALGEWFVETLGKILHVDFLGFAHWFI